MRKVPLFLLACLPLGAEVNFSYDPDAGRWTLRNSVMEAAVELSPEGVLSVRDLRDLRNGDAWAGIDRAPTRLQVDAEWLDDVQGFTLRSETARRIPRNGYRKIISLEDPRGRGRVQFEIEMFEDQPVLRYRTRFRNMQLTPVTVRGADLAAWNFDAGGHRFRAFRVNQWVKHGKVGNFETLTNTLAQGGAGISMLSGAYGQHCGWLAVRDENDRGFFAGWEFDGRAQGTLRHRAGVLAFSVRIEELNRQIGPNEEFVSPYAFLGLFHGDWDEAGYRTQRFTEAAIAKELPDDDFPYVVWDSWKYQTGIDEDTLRRNAELAARIGVELFVIDLGWARNIGDWHEDPRKFRPGGLRALSDYVHSLGMKFGLHFAFAEAAPESPTLTANRDWTSSEDYGYFEARSLCLSHEPVRDWIIDEADRVIEQYDVDWILQDGENMVKRCTKTTHTHAPDDSNYSNAVDGLNYVVQEIQRRNPRVHWENCEDGGNMMTFNMVGNYVTSIAADDSGPLTTRQAVHGITYPFSPRYADRYMPEEELGTYGTRSFMFGGPWIFMNRLADMRPQDLQLAASEIVLFKQIRGHIRDGKVFHVTARPTETGIDAIESYQPETDTAIVFVFCGDSETLQRNVTIRGLNPEKTYRVRYHDEGAPRPRTYTGAQLTRGITVRMPGKWSTHLIFVEPQ